MTEPPETGPLRRQSSPTVVRSRREGISAELALMVFRHMVRARAMKPASVEHLESARQRCEKYRAGSGG